MAALPEIHMPDDSSLPIDLAMEMEPIPEGTSGPLQVLHRTLPAGQPLEYFKEQVWWDEDKTFTILHRLGCTWMSDTPQETTAMHLAAREAKGDVLVTGLGLGIFQRSVPDAVRSVTTLEIDPDVVRLVWRHIAAGDKRQRCILGKAEDTMRAMEKAGREFDFIYLDTWDSGDYEQLPWVNWYVRQAYALLRDGGEIRAWTYESMVRSYVRDCLELLPMLKRNAEVAAANEKKRQGMRNMWPLVGHFIDWFYDGGHDEHPDKKTCRKWCERMARTYTETPGYMLRLSQQRQNEQAVKDLADDMKTDPLKVAMRYGQHVEKQRRRRRDDSGPMICKM